MSAETQQLAEIAIQLRYVGSGIWGAAMGLFIIAGLMIVRK